jgi:hypothetical protein
MIVILYIRLSQNKVFECFYPWLIKSPTDKKFLETPDDAIHMF